MQRARRRAAGASSPAEGDGRLLFSAFGGGDWPQGILQHQLSIGAHGANVMVHGGVATVSAFFGDGASFDAQSPGLLFCLGDVTGRTQEARLELEIRRNGAGAPASALLAYNVAPGGFTAFRAASTVGPQQQSGSDDAK